MSETAIERLRLVRTSYACPEQYDVFRGSENVGYLRLRWGSFRAECRDATVYEADIERLSAFPDEETRVHHLNAACRAISAALSSNGKGVESPIYDLEFAQS